MGCCTPRVFRAWTSSYSLALRHLLPPPLAAFSPSPCRDARTSLRLAYWTTAVRQTGEMRVIGLDLAWREGTDAKAANESGLVAADVSYDVSRRARTRCRSWPRPPACARETRRTRTWPEPRMGVTAWTSHIQRGRPSLAHRTGAVTAPAESAFLAASAIADTPSVSTTDEGKADDSSTHGPLSRRDPDEANLEDL